MSGREETEFREAMAVANIPTLLMVLHQLTGDERWLGDPYRPTPTRGLGDNDTGGLETEVQDEIRAAALDAVLDWRKGKAPVVPVPPPSLLLRMMSWSMGEPVPETYGQMITEMLGLPDPSEPDLELARPPDGFGVLIIGAGVSGLCAAVSLSRAAVPYTIVERNEAIGGIWLENRYPGAGVDTPSHLYSFSFAANDWSHYFAGRDELRSYLDRVATDFDIRPHIRFQTEVTGATWEESSQSWCVKIRHQGGPEEILRADVVISAVGAFNKPKMPEIDGLDTFQGTAVHTARWPPEGLELEGKRVAVIGNGASAMQLVPAVAPDVASVTVFQHSPQWAAPFDKFKTPVPAPIRFLIREVPPYHAWYRLRQAWIFNDRIYGALQKDPAWPHPARSINAINDGHRKFFTRYIESELGERQDLLEAVLPKYPPFGKRMLLDNRWFQTLTRDNVRVVTDPVRQIHGDRMTTTSGAEYEVDVIIFATGFDVVRFLAPIDIYGRSGETLRSTWDDDDPRAYLGSTIPDFPNFFCLYGPNTQTGHGGSVMFMVELQMRYVMGLLEQMFAEGIGSLECRQDTYDRYNKRVDDTHENMVWTHPGMDTYYRNSRGRVVVNNPFRVIDFWHMTRHGELADYILEPVRNTPGHEPTDDPEVSIDATIRTTAT